MAGKKGRSGRKPKIAAAAPPKPLAETSAASAGTETPLEFMIRVMNDPRQSVTVRSRMAITAAQYVHTKTGDGGKKDAKQAAADRAGKGKFSPAAPPKLAVVR